MINNSRLKILKVFLLGTLFFICSQSFGQRLPTDRKLDERANELAMKTGNEDFRKALVFLKQNASDSLLLYFLKTLNSSKNREVLDFAHYYRGEAFRKKRVFGQAEREFNAVSKDFGFYFRVQHYFGEMCLEEEKFKEAFNYFSKIDTTNKTNMISLRLDGIEHNISLCYFHLGKFKEAERYMLQSISRIEKMKDSAKLISSYMDLANIYYEQYLDAQAIVYFEKAYQISRHHGSFELKQNAALNMAVVEQNRNRWKEALQYRTEYESWRDSLNDQNKIYEVAQLEKKFAVDQKQRKVKLLETENRLKRTERNMYLFAAVLLLVILAFGTYFFRQNVKRSRIILAQKQELDILNATKDQLFSIVSHDLRSSVHALRTSNTELKDNLKAQRYDSLEHQLEQNSSIATNTYNMLDNLLHWALLQTKGGYFKQEEHRLSMLVDQVAYNFHALLNQKGLFFENKIPKSVKVFIDAESMKIVLRNFMDNSIKFSDEHGHIRLSLLEETESTVTIEWSDNGKGMSEETRLKLMSDSPHLTKKDHEKVLGSGLGMQLCKSMIKKNGGELNILSKLGSGTKMIVTLYKTAGNGSD